MRKSIYGLANKLGFKIQNKNRERKRRIKHLSSFCNLVVNYELLVDSYDSIKNLKIKFPEFKIERINDGFLVFFDNQKFIIHTREEFFILNEVYISLDYEFFTHKDVILFDIGANVGLSTLFFSKKEYIKQIYSFEPVEETYVQAKKNFQLNPLQSNKITSYNFGLAGEDKEVVFVFDNERKGRSGLRQGQNDLANKVLTKVVLKDVSKILMPIIKSNHDVSFVVKMDCEGAEYEIFENMMKGEILNHISIFMIEWHDKGADEINSILIRNNFTVFNNYLTPVSGMIYAVKQS
ncbi:FkbM family methyltransferase [Flavobacterium sp. TR2]|uniref:FkbM family methyltransferase n=1 Tax=Flavobacterium sp. TR2 TaxID=2977321 RepID=UPI0021B0F755|nr:FkbM family methyltransferase [Flavobacterium sp. TR2]UWY28608.1 FkbM family methyltransferase [Flavobacterium sp. TR2]